MDVLSWKPHHRNPSFRRSFRLFALKPLPRLRNLSIKSRRLYYEISPWLARNLNNLILLRDFFNGGYKSKSNQDPEFDFPRAFYRKKDVIVKRIDQLLEREQG